MGAENQKQHYETILNQYDSHYNDKWSTKYREEFIYGPLWRGLDFAGMRVADLACGSGFNSEALLKSFPTALPTGYDIAPSACQAYRERTGFASQECDLTKPMSVHAEFDAAMVIGGLHHCVADLHQTFRNVANLLKPGGIFMIVEPNSRYFLESVRKFWYRRDKKIFDAENERALSHEEILTLASHDFACRDIRFFGGPAYIAVLSSMIMRIPLGMKPFISPALMIAERAWSLIPGARMHIAFLARWIRS